MPFLGNGYWLCFLCNCLNFQVCLVIVSTVRSHLCTVVLLISYGRDAGIPTWTASPQSRKIRVSTHVFDNSYLFFQNCTLKNMAKSLLLKLQPHPLLWQGRGGGVGLIMCRAESSKSDFSGFSSQLCHLSVRTKAK